MLSLFQNINIKLFEFKNETTGEDEKIKKDSEKDIERKIEEKIKESEKKIEKKIEEKKFKGLVLSGGSFKGVVHLGALYYLKLYNMLENIDYFCGTSIGSIISYLLIIGYNADEIFSFSNDLIKSFELSNIMSGKIPLLDYDIIIGNLLNEKTIKKLGYIPTLKQLYETSKKTLICVTYNKTDKEIEYLSYKTNPSLSCLSAVKMSSSIPIIFEECSYNDKKYIDGGVIDNFPIQYLDEYLLSSENILGFNLVQIQSKGLISEIYNLFSIPNLFIEKNNIKRCSDKVFIISLYSDINFIGYSKENKINYFLEGYKQTKKMFNFDNTNILDILIS